jgi:S-adenosylmethionine decarboxylase
VTFFEAKARDGDDHSLKIKQRGARMETLEGYRRVDRIVHDLDGYELVFRYYERLDWKGGKPPRLGETGY